MTRAGKSCSKCAGAGSGNFEASAADDGLGVANARGHAQQNRHLPLLGNFDGAQHELVGFLRVGGLKHGHAGSQGIATIVLLVLTGGHAGIVGRYNDQRPVEADIGHGKQWVGSHVQADMLHGDERALAGKGDADSNLKRNFFVGRPLGFAAQFFEGFQYFCRGSAGVSGTELHPGIQGGHGDRLVTAEQ